jgi:hypothetical protein
MSRRMNGAEAEELTAALAADGHELAIDDDGFARPCENLSKAQRKATPVAFARMLLELARGCSVVHDSIAGLWVMSDTIYWRYWPHVEIWAKGRDANTYVGPWPVVCHPPCGPWGKYRTVSQESRDHGIRAMNAVHRWGGIVEQPLGSSLFREHGKDGHILQFDQGDWGHLAKKPTLIYVYSMVGCALPAASQQPPAAPANGKPAKRVPTSPERLADILHTLEGVAAGFGTPELSRRWAALTKWERIDLQQHRDRLKQIAAVTDREIAARGSIDE